MSPQTDTATVFKRLFFLVYLVIVVVCVYVLVSAIITSQNTGMLRLSSPNSQATLSISQVNHQAMIIGVGRAAVRLKPGTYQVSASYGGNHADAVVRIVKKQVTSSSLNPVGSTLPSVGNINFPNIDTLINSGLTTTQISALERAFFQYKSSAKIITINPDSVYPEPHDPNTSTSFTINFKVTVDSAPYNATISYSDLDSVRLYLYNPLNNSQVFDSYATTTTPR